jgi:hypothetical protein
MNERTCGTCDWSEPIEDRPDAVDCAWHEHHKLPLAIVYNQSYMRVNEGLGCDCWKPKVPANPDEKQGQAV